MGKIERLERLNELREKGALSDDEFQQQKSLILSEADNEPALPRDDQPPIAPQFSFDETKTPARFNLPENVKWLFIGMALLGGIALIAGYSPIGDNQRAIGPIVLTSADPLELLSEERMEFTKGDPNSTAAKAIALTLDAGAICEFEIDYSNYFAYQVVKFLINGENKTMQVMSNLAIGNTIQNYGIELQGDKIKLSAVGDDEYDRKQIELLEIWKVDEKVRVLAKINDVILATRVMTCEFS